MFKLYNDLCINLITNNTNFEKMINDKNYKININNTVKYASYFGHYRIIKYLLKNKKINSNFNNNYIFKIAYKYKHDKIIKLLNYYQNMNKLNN